MGKWFQPGTKVKGISGYAQTFGKKGIIVRGRDNNGIYMVRWNDGTISSVTIQEISSLKFKVKE